MNFVQKFNDRFQKALEQKAFPTEVLSGKWIVFAIQALSFTSLMALGINPVDWKALIGIGDTKEAKDIRLNLYQFALLSNNLQARTPNELQLPLDAYHELMEEADSYVKIWTEETESLRKEIEAVLLEEQKLEQEQIAKNVEAAKNNNGLKPVIGQA